MFELFDHTADLGIRVRAESLEQLFSDAARAILATIVVNYHEVQPFISRTITIQSDELDLMLFDWLSEFLFLFETEQLIFSRFDLSISDSKLKATCFGQHVDEAVHELHHEVKAITYHEFKLARTKDHWLAEFIVDI